MHITLELGSGTLTKSSPRDYIPPPNKKNLCPCKEGVWQIVELGKEVELPWGGSVTNRGTMSSSIYLQINYSWLPKKDNYIGFDFFLLIISNYGPISLYVGPLDLGTPSYFSVPQDNFGQ